MTTTTARPGVATAPRIGVLNLMPKAAEFEAMLMPQFAAAAPIQPVWLRVRGRRYSLDDPADINARYVAPHDAGPLDAVVITGGAVEHLPFSEVRFLDEVGEVLDHAVAGRLPVLGLCWGALAVGHLLLGLSHQIHPTKVSGMFETDLLVEDHAVGSGLDDRFWTAHSRFAGFDESSVDRAVAAGRVRVLARAGLPAGTVIAESADHSVLMHVGHPEYGGARLADEYRRDLALGLSDVYPPANVDLDHPVCRWRSHSLMFFATWVDLVYGNASRRDQRPAVRRVR